MQSKIDYCSRIADTVKPATFLEDLFNRYPAQFESILKNRKEWNVQVIYTRVDRDMNNIPILKNHYFNTDAASYFYPASTIKLPIVMLVLERLNELKTMGIDMNSTMLTETDHSGQTAVYNEAMAKDGRPTIANYIKKILLVSDNDAFNRLYEFLGQEYINSELHKKGYTDVQIRHRLNIFLTEEENRHTNPVIFPDSNNKIIFQQPARYNKSAFQSRKDSLGNAFYQGGILIKKPMDFSGKNRISLPDLHQILISLIFPEHVPDKQKFNLTEADKAFMMKYMSQLPTESISPPYADDVLNYPPAYSKFLFYGMEGENLTPDIRIFNKTGDAYGHMLDIAYLVDFKNKIEFFVSAVIYCNSDGILNDDRYDYVSTGLPFLKNLGRVLYDYELKRERKNKPNFNSIQFKYDK